MPKNNPHFCILGAGAIGGLIAAHLCKSGYPVSCIARGSTYSTLLSEGIKVLKDTTEIHLSLIHI